MIFEKASVPFAKGHKGGQSGSCSKRNFRKIWINVKTVEHAKRRLRWTIKAFVNGKMSNGAVLFAKRI